MTSPAAFPRLLSHLKSRGFLFPSAPLYNGLAGVYDFGPLGTLLKNNIRDRWWRDLVVSRPDVQPLDSAILTHRSTLRASGHLDNFTDPMCEAALSGARFRSDKSAPVAVTRCERTARDVIEIRPGAGDGDAPGGRAPDSRLAAAWAEQIRQQLAPGARVDVRGGTITLYPVTVADGHLVLEAATEAESAIKVPYFGVAEPGTNSPFLRGAPRPFNLMFRTSLGAVDPLGEVQTLLGALDRGASPPAGSSTAGDILRTLDQSTVYLRPETAQGIFQQFPNVCASQGAGVKLPFGIAQVGKAFRNEIRTEQSIFRTAEFEQLEMEWFCHPADGPAWYRYWRDERTAWWRRLLANRPEDIRVNEALREAGGAEAAGLAHYAQACADIEYRFPWGWDELEGVADRGTFDLDSHQAASGQDLAVTPHVVSHAGPDFQPFVPRVIEPSAGLSRAVLAVLCDAYTEVVDPGTGAEGSGGKARRPDPRVVLRLHPSVAPIKAAVLPVVRRPELVRRARAIAAHLRRAGLLVQVDVARSIGRRYVRQDAIGTPWCITIDRETVESDGGREWPGARPGDLGTEEGVPIPGPGAPSPGLPEPDWGALQPGATVTLRNRDTGEQTRVAVRDLVSLVARGTGIPVYLDEVD
ncbi:hypothetical protein H696_02328 [Fonticula alba]|uniref:Aminoacyl-transfer RNA synthetases class-II family profile domain-containing protein n=1 Tax=Fonticula alba TaxID=691883 RepID=A0A058ZD62_FONAL|nr:hypothetical protein H696_02328 [Fonticula alba]KCV71377.1 hypothetical protein H696_02328 [Fonticula alba]|eukprot:XP_009494500.1 hypothetical protein H696_02328 [Fonticula alba]